MALDTLATSFTAWLSLWESCQARQGLTERAQAVSLGTKVLSTVRKLSGAPERVQPYIITLYRQSEAQPGIDGG